MESRRLALPHHAIAREPQANVGARADSLCYPRLRAADAQEEPADSAVGGRCEELVDERRASRVPMLDCEDRAVAQHANADAGSILDPAQAGVLAWRGPGAQKRVLLTAVATREDAAIGRTEARVTIRARDGRSFTRHVEHALGSLARPMSDADLETKFRALAQDVLPAAQAEAIIELCWRVAELDDGGAIARAAATRA